MKDLIAKIAFFNGLDDKILKKVADACIQRQFTRNETIVRQGEMGLGVYIVSKGKVKIETKQGQLLAELGPEQFFGDMSLVDNKPRSATATALEDTEALLLTRDSFVKLMNKYPEIPIRVMRVLSERLRAANEKLNAAPKAAPAPAPAGAPAAAAPPAAPAPSAAAPAAPAAAPAAPAAVPAVPDDSTKGSIQKTLLEVFDSLYSAKAMTRLSVAVLGCPVEGSSPDLIAEVRAGDVKMLFFPAGEAVDMRIAARAAGSFTLHVFEPSRPQAVAFGPIAIDTGRDFHVSFGEPGGVSLRRG